MKKYPHQIFIEENLEQISKMPVPVLLQKRLIGFDELLEDLPHTIGTDREILEEKLDSLSHELLEDLEENYEHHLENNDPIEEEEPGQRHESHQEPQEEIYERDENEYIPEEVVPQEMQTEQEESEEHRNETETHENSEAVNETKEVHEEKPEEEHYEEPIPEPSDEDLITDIYNAGFKKIHPSILKHKGYKGHLHTRSIQIGRFHLKRGKYDTHYTIYLKSDE